MAFYIRQRQHTDDNGTVVTGTTWQCVHHRPHPGKPGKRITQSKTFGPGRQGKADAKAWGVDQDRRYARNPHTLPHDDKATFAELAEKYLTIARPRLKPSSYHRAEAIIRAHLLPEFASAPIQSITREWIRDYLSNLAAGTQPEYHSNGSTNGHAGKPYRPGTVKMVHSRLSGVFEEAVERHYIDVNPAHGVMRRQRIVKHKPRPQIDVLTPQEVHALADAMPRASDRAAVLTAAYTGLRASELWSLRRKDIDLIRGRVTVARSIAAWQDGQPVYGTTKTDRVRTVELAPEIVELLAAHLTPTTTAISPDALVFTDRKGNPIRQTVWYRNPYRSVAQKVLPTHPRLRFHDLRHTWATWLLSGAANPAWVAKQGGWASTKVLLDTYAHAMPEDDDRGRAVLTTAFQSATEPNVIPLHASATS